MAREKIQELTAHAKHRAEALAAEHLNRGARSDASELDRVCAELARLILENAARGAEFVPASMLDQPKAEIARLEAEAEADPTPEGIASALASLERLHEKQLVGLEQHALKAWEDAVAKMLEIGTPLGGPPTSASAH